MICNECKEYAVWDAEPIDIPVELDGAVKEETHEQVVQTLSQWRGRLRDLRRTKGPSTGLELCMGPLLDRWLDYLDNNTELGLDDLCGLAVAINDALPFRDALIISVIIDHDKWDTTQLMRFAAHSRTQAVGTSINKLLSEAFDDPKAAPDPRRNALAQTVMVRIAQNMGEEYAVQADATCAYLLWWEGNPLAEPLALHALAKDSQCSLAAIVMAALERDIWPAWARGAEVCPEYVPYGEQRE